MFCRYTGTEPCRMGSSLIRNGDTCLMAFPINKLWVPVIEPKPVTELTVAKKVKKEDNG